MYTKIGHLAELGKRVTNFLHLTDFLARIRSRPDLSIEKRTAIIYPVIIKAIAAH
jgi:hypothetical protein